MKCHIENIKESIAREYGFGSWRQYFDCFITTHPGRKVLQNGIRRVLSELLNRPDDFLACPNCFIKHYELKELNVKAGLSCFHLRRDLREMNRKTRYANDYSFY